MDSLTQAVLGAAVGFAVAGKSHPRRALLYGAAIATLPDLDIVVQYDNALDSFTRHRSFSHSLFVHILISPVLAFLCARNSKYFSLREWFWMFLLCLTTHALLDALTVYGTQLFWPLNYSPVMGGSVFIIDPLYTLPLFILFMTVLIRPMGKQNLLLAYGLLLLGTMYLTSSLILQSRMSTRVASELDRQNINTERVLITAAPFTTFLWRVIVISDSFYYQGFASIFDENLNIKFQRVKRGKPFLKLLSDSEYYDQLNWFSHGFNAARIEDKKIIVSDLRMGVEPLYVFQFSLADQINNQWQYGVPKKLAEPDIPKETASWVFKRIFNQNVPLFPTGAISISKTRNNAES